MSLQTLLEAFEAQKIVASQTSNNKHKMLP